MTGPRIFFPNGSIRMPPANGPDVHRFELVRHLSELGAVVVTLEPDENPHAHRTARSLSSVLGEVRRADAIYCRLNEGFASPHALTLPGVRHLIPDTTPVLWEANLAPSTSVRLRSRPAAAIRRTNRLLRASARRVDVAIGVTEPVSRELRELLAIDRVVTIPNAVDPRRFDRVDRPPLAERPLRCVWIPSQNNTIHDFDLVAATADVIDLHGWPISIEVIGDRALPIQPRSCLQVRPPLAYDDLAEELTQFDVGLVLYRGTVDRGSPLKLFDYLAAGCVPVCSPGAGVSEIVDDRLGYVARWDADTLTELLTGLRTREDELRSLRHAGWRAVDDRYNWRTVAAQVLALIDEARERRTPGRSIERRSAGS